MRNILYIDTSSPDEVEVVLNKDNQSIVLKGKSKKFKAQQILMLIDKLLRSQKLKIQHIDRIEVNTGPGSFTGLRVGVAVANSIGWALDVPINDAGYGKITTPIYRT